MAENTKKRTWTFVLYPESAPEDWREKIRLSGLVAAVSPLHDKDINPTGEAKKPHYHILLVYSGPTTYNSVAKFTASLNSTIPQALESVRGMYRYFSHKYNPEKYQYDEREITTINGFNIADLVELTKGEVNELKAQILQIVEDNNIEEYSALVRIFNTPDTRAEFDIVVNNTFFFNAYITSRRHARYDEEERAQKELFDSISAGRRKPARTEKVNFDEIPSPFA